MPRRDAVRVAPVLACVVFVAILAPYHDLVPFWDSREYADCVVAAARQGFDPLKLNCLGHPTMLYATLLRAGQLADPGSTAALLAVNVLLGCLALFAFHRIALRLIPAEERGASLLPGLATLAFALHPVFLAGAAFLTPDYAVAVFVLLATAFLLEGRIAGAVVAGTFAVWSKEPGVVVYTIVASLWVVCRVLASGAPRDAGPRRLAWLALPTVSFAVLPLLKRYGLVGLPFYETNGGPGLLASSMDAGSLPVLLGYLALVFVLNVAWLPSSLAFLGAARWLVDVRFRALSSARGRLADSEVFRDRLVVALALAASTLVLTRFPTFLNARYFMPLFPLLLLCALAGVHALTARAELRALAMGAVALAFGASIWRTSDPVSRAIFGTFQFGDHAMLRMTSLTGECCGYGRDQLVYNLQFARFHYVMDEMLPDLTSAPRPPAVAWPGLDWHFFGPVDRRTGRRTLRREGSTPFVTIPSVPVVDGQVRLERFDLIEFPNFSAESPLPRLLDRYAVTSRTWYGSDGYRASVVRLRRKLEVPPAEPANGR